MRGKKKEEKKSGMWVKINDRERNESLDTSRNSLQERDQKRRRENESVCWVTYKIGKPGQSKSEGMKAKISFQIVFEDQLKILDKDCFSFQFFNFVVNFFVRCLLIGNKFIS